MTRSPTWDAIVVGSGFGGAVSAARLAEQGLKVLILERGTWWDGATTPQQGATRLLRGVRWSAGSRSASIRFRRGGLYEVHQFDHLTCVVASGVGGGSLIYTDMQVPPTENYFESLPAEITADEMRPHFAAVHAMLSAGPVAHSFKKVRAFEQALATAGLGAAHYPDLAMTVDEHRRSMRSTMGATYIPLALRHGAVLRSMSEVTAIEQHPPGWRIRYRDHARGRSYMETSPRLVLSAGTLGTMRLLFAARDWHKTAPLLSSALGRGFSPNGDMLSAVHRTAARIEGDDGPPICAYRADTVNGRDFLTAEVGLRLHHLALPVAVTRLVPRTALLVGMGADRIAADVTYDGRNLRISADRGADPQMYDLISAHARQIAAGYRARHTIINVPFGSTSRRLASVHPLGGVRIADTPAQGVVDHTGQAHGYPRLFISDGSILPAAPGVPPSMTIAAFAERQSAFIANS